MDAQNVEVSKELKGITFMRKFNQEGDEFYNSTIDG